MGLGFYTGLRNRNTRIRERKETLEDQQAQRDLWQTQFDSNAEQTMKEIRERNRLATKISETEAEAAITAADVEFGRKKEILKEEQDFELKKIQVNYDNTLEKMGIESGYADDIADKNIAASMKELIIRGEQNQIGRASCRERV